MSRKPISDSSRMNYSSRASKGYIGVTKKQCPYCNHHKAITNMKGKKCAKCKRYY